MKFIVYIYSKYFRNESASEQITQNYNNLNIRKVTRKYWYARQQLLVTLINRLKF